MCFCLIHSSLPVTYDVNGDIIVSVGDSVSQRVMNLKPPPAKFSGFF